VAELEEHESNKKKEEEEIHVAMKAAAA